MLQNPEVTFRCNTLQHRSGRWQGGPVVIGTGRATGALRLAIKPQLDRPLYRLRERYKPEEGLWIEVILAGLVDHAQLPVFLRQRIGNRDINFPRLQRNGITVIFHTNHQLPQGALCHGTILIEGV